MSSDGSTQSAETAVQSASGDLISSVPVSPEATPAPADFTNIAVWFRQAFGGLARGELNEASTALLFKLVVPAVVSVVLIVVAYFVASLLARWFATAVCKRVDETLGKFVGRITFYSVMIASSLGILSTAGISVAGAAAILTAAGFAIGLAFQGTLSNFSAGVLLLVFRPFKVGDMVLVGGVTGRVNEIDLFTTTLDTTDNRRLVLPNSSIASNTIENITFHPHRRVDIVIGVAYRSDMDETRKVLTAACESLEDIMIPGEDRGFQILLSNLNSSSVDWTIRFWTATTNFWIARERLIVAAKKQLDLNNIQIPFPQMHLHFDDMKPLETLRSEAHPAIPMPRMATSGAAPSQEKTRPRARGDANHVA